MSDTDGLDAFRASLARCWSADTSSDLQGWTADNPSWGQCAVTACLVQDLFGGEIVWTAAATPDAQRHSQYFNKLPNGTTIDLTRGQFPSATVFEPPEGCPRTAGKDGPSFPTTRDYVLSFPATLRRYKLLRARIEEALKRGAD